MSLELLDTKIDALRVQATDLNAGYRTYVTEVNNDPTLSLEGRARLLNARYERVTEQVAALKEREDALIASERLTLDRRIGGTTGQSGQDLIAFRDARDRANRLRTDQEATTAIGDAITARDDQLATAILNRSIEAGFHNATDAYIAEHPAIAESIADLFDLARRNTGFGWKFEQAGKYLVIR